MTSIRKLALALCLAGSFSYSNAQVDTQTHNIPDDGYANVPLQFDFPYYGQTFNNSWMFSNGIISFQDPDQSGLNGQNLSVQPMSDTMGSQFNYSIFPLWTDLINISGTFRTDGTKDFQQYSWIGISPYYNGNRFNTFTVEIKPDGSISANYSLVDVDYGQIGLTGNTSLGEFDHIASLGRTTSLTDWQRVTQGVTPPTEDPCISDPLSSSSCPGYAQAYYDQQCSIDALYNSGCPGYETAYFNYQCTQSPLYNTACPGYAQAYFDQQCGFSALYNTQCPGYAAAKILKDLQEQLAAPTESTVETSIVASTGVPPTTASSATVALADPTRTETVVTTDVGGVELTTTGEISIPTGEPAAIKEAVKEAAKEEEKKQEEKKAEGEKKRVDPKALAVARAAAREAEATALSTAESAVAFSQSDTATSAALGLGTGITIGGFRPLGVGDSTEEDGKATQTTSTSKDSNLNAQNNTAAQGQQQDVAQKTGPAVRNGGRVEGMEGGPDPAQLARAPMDFNQYLNSQLRDAQFYASKDIYKGQRNVDNQRLLRGLTGGSDRLHEQMINQQYNITGQ